MSALAGTGDDSVIKDILVSKLNEQIQTAIGKALNDSKIKTALDNALKLKTYEKVRAIEMSTAANILTNLADQVPGKVASKADSYVSQYMGTLVGKIPASASIELNGVTISKGTLDELADATTTSEAIKEVAKIIKKFGTLKIADFENGVEGAVNYGDNSADFVLKLDVQ